MFIKDIHTDNLTNSDDILFLKSIFNGTEEIVIDEPKVIPLIKKDVVLPKISDETLKINEIKNEVQKVIPNKLETNQIRNKLSEQFQTVKEQKIVAKKDCCKSKTKSFLLYFVFFVLVFLSFFVKKGIQPIFDKTRFVKYSNGISIVIDSIIITLIFFILNYFFISKVDS